MKAKNYMPEVCHSLLVSRPIKTFLYRGKVHKRHTQQYFSYCLIQAQNSCIISLPLQTSSNLLSHGTATKGREEGRQAGIFLDKTNIKVST
jgi:hypothetical protein